MTPKRRRQLECSEDGCLTSEEMTEGWHFCPEWDFMITKIGLPIEQEGEHCNCTPWTPAEILHEGNSND